GGAEPLGQSEFDVISGVVEAPGQVTRGARRAAVREVTCAAPDEDVVSRNVWPALVGVEEPDRLLKRVAVIEGCLAKVWSKGKCQDNDQCCEQVRCRAREQAAFSSDVFLAHEWLLRKLPGSAGAIAAFAKSSETIFIGMRPKTQDLKPNTYKFFPRSFNQVTVRRKNL